MKVILLEDVKKVGKKGEIVEVSEAYGRNVLIKKGVGLEGTPQNLNNAKQKLGAQAHKKQVDSDEATVLASQLSKVSVTIPVKMGDGGRVFGSVTGKDISDALQAQVKVDVDKKKIDLPNGIQALGYTNVKIKIHNQVEGTIKVHVVEQ